MTLAEDLGQIILTQNPYGVMTDICVSTQLQTPLAKSGLNPPPFPSGDFNACKNASPRLGDDDFDGLAKGYFSAKGKSLTASTLNILEQYPDAQFLNWGFTSNDANPVTSLKISKAIRIRYSYNLLDDNGNLVASRTDYLVIGYEGASW